MKYVVQIYFFPIEGNSVFCYLSFRKSNFTSPFKNFSLIHQWRPLYPPTLSTDPPPPPYIPSTYVSTKPEHLIFPPESGTPVPDPLSCRSPPSTPPSPPKSLSWNPPPSGHR
ncbi:hypothetical protein LINGRAHAP2_LOCUS7938 [Linum grandiflorum]